MISIFFRGKTFFRGISVQHQHHSFSFKTTKTELSVELYTTVWLSNYMNLRQPISTVTKHMCIRTKLKVQSVCMSRFFFNFFYSLVNLFSHSSLNLFLFHACHLEQSNGWLAYSHHSILDRSGYTHTHHSHGAS